MRLEIAGRWCCSLVHPGQYLLSDEGETVMRTLSTRQCEKNVDNICFLVPASGAGDCFWNTSLPTVHHSNCLGRWIWKCCQSIPKMVALLKTAHCCLNPLGSLDAWPDRYFVLGALLRMMPLIHLVWFMRASSWHSLSRLLLSFSTFDSSSYSGRVMLSMKSDY